MIKGFVVEENMSHLTCTSGEVSASSSSRVETGTMYTQASTDQAPPPKKKRNLPGNPDPDAEVIALSPKSLMATNRFICEICNKGFQRDQNLQLHRRGHNLPWKLKQKSNKVERRKVYVCPEPTCVHNDPSRALGDLTGIKKHFSRKHGEKKWKCEKCSKRYAVQSDWKAHSKICGTREYRCDCGKLFSRRDSFITHRAFCDVLAEESARAITTNPFLSSQQPNSLASNFLNLPPQLQTHGLQPLSVKREQDQHHIFNPRPNNNSVPPWLACPQGTLAAGPGTPHIDFSSPLFSGSCLDQSIIDRQNPNSNALAKFQSQTSSPHMSATALLQKAAEMGVTMSKSSPLHSAMLRPHQAHMYENIGSTSTVGSALGLSSREELASGFVHSLASFGNKAAVTSSFMEQFGACDAATGAGGGASPSLLHDMMSCLSSASGFDEGLNGYHNLHETFSRTTEPRLSQNDHDNKGSDGLTRDFLGLKAFPHRDFINMTGLDRINSSSSSSAYEQHNQNQRPWQG
ncbi:protein indeterminate-domain 7-like [Pistacia vera]|uniref:protein indeterminate-domain 7-like n=1 Tax=Pistacia vera TaxID=55513 RepID=UPI001262CA21|nr:protein indeterminate-domain 7-like [Pistacia vera]